MDNFVKIVIEGSVFYCTNYLFKTINVHFTIYLVSIIDKKEMNYHE